MAGINRCRLVSGPLHCTDPSGSEGNKKMISLHEQQVKQITEQHRLFLIETSTNTYPRFQSCAQPQKCLSKHRLHCPHQIKQHGQMHPNRCHTCGRSFFSCR